MKRKYRLVIFDLDGTLLNTLEDLTDSVNHMMRLYGFPERTLLEVRSFVGDGIRKLLERSAPADTTAEVIDRLFSQFKEYYGSHCAEKTRPYDGITELLRELREAGCLTAVVSNKADSAVGPLCEKYFPSMFVRAVGERKGVPRKPAPDSVNMLLGELAVAKDEAVYVGDSNIDVATALNAQLDCIAVAWGFRDEEVLIRSGAKIIAHNADELKKYILG